jgi:hypothetical protein
MTQVEMLPVIAALSRHYTWNGRAAPGQKMLIFWSNAPRPVAAIPYSPQASSFGYNGPNSAAWFFA